MSIMKYMKKTIFCPICDEEMIYVKHIEDDGDRGSDESYWECPNNCVEREII